MKHTLLLPCLGLSFVLLAAPAHAGYSHYFTWNRKPDEAKLKECLARMRQVVSASRALLAGPDAEGDPIVERLQLQINGRGEEFGHEPFIFPGQVGPNFCKTAGKPYDAAVTACLLVARDHFPADVLEIASDGSWSNGDWADGQGLYQRVFGKAPSNPAGASAWDSQGGPNRETLVFVAAFGFVILGGLALKKAGYV